MRERWAALVLAAAVGGSAGSCAHGQDGAGAGAVEALEGVRIDRARGAVEFDGVVPVSAHLEETPNVYLELFVCGPDTREHESLVVTRARPSDIHAALLLVGLEPGSPGRWTENEDGSMGLESPRGDEVVVEFVWTAADGVKRTDSAASWVRHVRTGEAFPDRRFVFAGSRMVVRQGAERYDADGTGVVVGLTTFGSEVVAWPGVISPEASVDEPVWIANPETTPPVGTAVTVVVRRAG